MRGVEAELLDSETTGIIPREVEVTLLFCDVVRSTELTRRLGDRGAYRVIRSFHDMVSAACAQRDGERLELRGDGVLLGFEKPQQAVACALEIQRRLAAGAREPRLHVRIGIHTGRALRIPGGYFGANVILAARVAEAAAPGEILVSVELAQCLSGSGIGLEAGRWASLKGIPEPSLVFALPESAAAEAPAEPAITAGALAALRSALQGEADHGGEEVSCMLAGRSAS
jgi:class 3 adenylate cyclase